MTIGIDAREICDRPAGKGQYLLRLLWQWQQDSSLDLILYTSDQQKLPESLSSKNIVHVAQKGRGIFWHRAVSSRLNRDQVQVFFAALSYQSAIWNSIPTITVVHDLAIFRLANFSHNKKAQLVERLTLKKCVKSSAHLIAVSQSTKHDLTQLMKADPQKISVFYEASMLVGASKKKPLPFKERQPFFFFTGTLEPRKNITTICKAYAALPEHIREKYELKLAGKPGWGNENYPEQVLELGIANRVSFLGYVPDAELIELFRTATVFLFPSLYEGFGLPVIEAMSVGTPVITSNTSSLPEVVGEHGITCNPMDFEAIAEKIEKLVTDPTEYESYSQYLYDRAATFQWGKIAKHILKVVSQAQ